MEVKKRASRSRHRNLKVGLADSLSGLQATGRNSPFHRFSFDDEANDRIRKLLAARDLKKEAIDALIIETEWAVSAYLTYVGPRNRRATSSRLKALAVAAGALKAAYGAVRGLPEFEALQNWSDVQFDVEPSQRVEGEPHEGYLAGGRNPRWRRGIESFDEGFLALLEKRAAAASQTATPATKRRNESEWFLAYQLIDAWKRITGRIPADTRSDIPGRTGFFHEFVELVAAAPAPHGRRVIAPSLESTVSKVLAAAREK